MSNYDTNKHELAVFSTEETKGQIDETFSNIFIYIISSKYQIKELCIKHEARLHQAGLVLSWTICCGHHHSCDSKAYMRMIDCPWSS